MFKAAQGQYTYSYFYEPLFTKGVVYTRHSKPGVMNRVSKSFFLQTGVSERKDRWMRDPTQNSNSQKLR